MSSSLPLNQIRSLSSSFVVIRLNWKVADMFGVPLKGFRWQRRLCKMYSIDLTLYSSYFSRCLLKCHFAPRTANYMYGMT
ncbi:hypothetical protein GDO81_016289 [Engystomops pustulosus]|uniref:Uncharacterized protein n=1 Tax=Engystomops pustulosus TaxID=76066 RepID=A0AAV7AVD2_ENGPU|nr:hypothetical protein GDO81_016289 [Engystomops pustulosus]